MKTTIEISDALFLQAKKIAQRDCITLRALFEQGLSRALAERSRPQKPFKMRDGSVRGQGLTDETIARGGWSALRDIANER
jgi:hypothetical protein